MTRQAEIGLDELPAKHEELSIKLHFAIATRKGSRDGIIG